MEIITLLMTSKIYCGCASITGICKFLYLFSVISSSLHFHSKCVKNFAPRSPRVLQVVELWLLWLCACKGDERGGLGMENPSCHSVVAPAVR